MSHCVHAKKNNPACTFEVRLPHSVACLLWQSNAFSLTIGKKKQQQLIKIQLPSFWNETSVAVFFFVFLVFV